ncbi:MULTISPECIES: DUF3248 domain-containing protein [Thermus]|uniref:DUF3248 domain-containing protein n=2 Tax=Thermus aquaticus TaxID=271 RepID=A0A0M9AHW2_THEAQ|nr:MULTISPECIES: DUF3248 domain-containing protein [Thermus]ALJ91448.1 hypothetical protein TO73_1609 [Thermus aquaticus Y51MC23]KOX90971.1 hypothetical protein BVI061214_02170 [Thermus aquaticus]MDT7908607.1 DUF3248 domain-containing protein [Thermus sp.]MDT7921518.1 DUF3248 domain-containing protein [Thermus sp.]
MEKDLLEALGQHLVWRIGRAEEEEVLVVRVGLASATPRFKELPRLVNIPDAEIERLAREGRVRVEWVEG